MSPPSLRARFYDLLNSHDGEQERRRRLLKGFNAPPLLLKQEI